MWAEFRPGSDVSDEWPRRPIREIPTTQEHPKDTAYWIAGGHFKAANEIPDHVVFKLRKEYGVPAGKLERQYTRNDAVFVVEHRWRETLTDVVTLDGMRKAREELAPAPPPPVPGKLARLWSWVRDRFWRRA